MCRIIVPSRLLKIAEACAFSAKFFRRHEMAQWIRVERKRKTEIDLLFHITTGLFTAEMMMKCNI